jgi:hypothetical protein
MSQPTTKAANSSAAPKASGLPIASIVIPLCLVCGYIIWKFIMGNPDNFEGGDALKGHPKQGNVLGIIYKGGFIVPLLMAFFMIVVIFSIERFITLAKANGSGRIEDFVRRIKFNLEKGDVNAAISECDKQKGSVANVVRAVLSKYKDVYTVGEGGVIPFSKVMDYVGVDRNELNTLYHDEVGNIWGKEKIDSGDYVVGRNNVLGIKDIVSKWDKKFETSGWNTLLA